MEYKTQCRLVKHSLCSSLRGGTTKQTSFTTLFGLLPASFLAVRNDEERNSLNSKNYLIIIF